MGGKASIATAFKVNTTARDIDVSFELDFMIGAMAAMALPPQIAVPDEIKYPNLRPTLKYLLNKTPPHITSITEKIVRKIPSDDDCRESMRFIPKPRPITANFNRYEDVFEVYLSNSLPRVNANTIPANRDIAGDRNSEPTASDRNSIFFIVH